MATSSLRPVSLHTGPYRAVASTTGTLSLGVTSTIYTAPSDCKYAAYRMWIGTSVTAARTSNYADGYWFVGTSSAEVPPGTPPAGGGQWTTYAYSGFQIVVEDVQSTAGADQRVYSNASQVVNSGQSLFVRYAIQQGSAGTISWRLYVKEYL